MISLNHRDEQRRRQGEVHHQRVEFRHVVIVDVAHPPREVSERHHEEYGHKGVEDHVEQVEVPCGVLPNNG
jgi:hypothetical protein